MQLGNDWTYLADVPGRYCVQPAGRLLAAVSGQTLYVVIGDEARDVVFAYKDGNWRTITTHAWPDGSTAIALMDIEGKPTVLLAAPATGEHAATELACTWRRTTPNDTLLGRKTSSR